MAKVRKKATEERNSRSRRASAKCSRWMAPGERSGGVGVRGDLCLPVDVHVAAGCLRFRANAERRRPISAGPTPLLTRVLKHPGFSDGLVFSRKIGHQPILALQPVDRPAWTGLIEFEEDPFSVLQLNQYEFMSAGLLFPPDKPRIEVLYPQEYKLALLFDSDQLIEPYFAIRHPPEHPHESIATERAPVFFD